MSILLLPFKIVFLIIAFILKGILYLLAFILNFISEVLVALQYILGSIFVLIAIGGTVVHSKWFSYRFARGRFNRRFVANFYDIQLDVLFK